MLSQRPQAPQAITFAGAPAPGQYPAPAVQGGRTVTTGLVTAHPLHVALEMERRQSQATQSQPTVTGLAAHIRQAWTQARMAKQLAVEERMLQSMRARRGDYDPDKLGAIREMGGSELYTMLTSVKCRAASSWIRDVYNGSGSDRPWSIKPQAVPDMPPEIGDAVVGKVAQRISDAEKMGVTLDDEQVIEIMEQLRDEAKNELNEQATAMANNMADKMETQLNKGGFPQALDQFVDDIATFPCAIIKGPIVRNRPTLSWVKSAAQAQLPAPGGSPGQAPPPSYAPVIQNAQVLEWERVSPFNIYPSPASTGIDDGDMIERHKLTRTSLSAMIGIQGYDDATIRVCLDQYGRGGLSEWLTNDVAVAEAEGKSTVAIMGNQDGLIDALQYWGSVQGKMLIDMGFTREQVPDETAEHHIEAWLIGPYVIKAVMNEDPLNRKPYYKASYEDVPGSFWGNSVADLVRDPQTVVNSAARALVNNMAMASGPQVGVNVDRMPNGETLTQMTPWRIWQFLTDPLNGSNGPPITFFQPESNVEELMQVFEKFSELADEYSGIPRYLAGDGAGGSGRTASGLSMLMNNAGKSIKQVISNTDMNVMSPLLERLYQYNMQYSDDPALKGDVSIIAKGASALMAQEAAQLRRNEFLAATANPMDMQIMGIKGRAAVLREVVKTLDIDPDEVIPPNDMLDQLIAQLQAQQAAAAAQAAMIGKPPPDGPPGVPPAQGGSPANPTINRQTLANGAPITDNFAPAAAPS